VSVRSYGELEGGVGPLIAFRATRVRVPDLVSPETARIHIGGQAYPMNNVSMSGVSLITPLEGEAWPIDTDLEVCVRVADEVVYTGRARVARTEHGVRDRRVGLRLLTGFLDLPRMRRHHEERSLELALERGPEGVRTRVDEGYRHATERVMHFVQYYRRCLDYHEQRYRENEIDPTRALGELTERALVALRQPWRELTASAAQVAARIAEDDDKVAAAKEYTEAMLTPLLASAPLINRSYLKPLGYPGDYRIMEYIYENRPEGDSVFGKVFHKLTCEEPLAAGIRARKELLKELTRAEHQRHANHHGKQPFCVANLGCGPARDVSEHVSETRTWPSPVEWTLIDQEEQALSLAYESVFRAIAENNAPVSLRCLYLSFVQLLRGHALVVPEASQHLVYSAGLFDYLREGAARTLLRALYDRVKPGGVVAVGNAIGPNTHAWTVQYVFDWPAVYRSVADMRALADGLPGVASVEVRAEAAGAFHFVIVRKA
jgi:extracellular factor (EF) 3-hydroxypalmitic acid methyl ester biosynthesis protein